MCEAQLTNTTHRKDITMKPTSRPAFVNTSVFAKATPDRSAGRQNFIATALVSPQALAQAPPAAGGAASAPGKRCQSLNGVYQFSLDTQSYNPLYSVPLKASSYHPVFTAKGPAFRTE